jgi:hypothetical protein|tara:strand:- start:287 stop:1399 length:1113 start_codon:yes stop_codon:yes gene_type:complete
MSIAGANTFEDGAVEGVGQTTVSHTDIDTDIDQIPAGTTIANEDHVHVDYDLAHKACLAEIASLFEDIQADLRIITDRGDDRSKGIYQRQADTVANNPANIAKAALDYINLQQSDILDMVNAEVGNPTNLGNTSAANYNAVRNSSANSGGFRGGGAANVQSADYGAGVSTAITGVDGKIYYEGSVPLDQIPLADGTGEGNVTYDFTGVRNIPIQSELMNILKTAAQSAGVDVVITSGGQVPVSEGGVKGRNRAGSNRHDKGYAADCRLFTGTKANKTRLFTTNQEQLGIILKFAQACRDAGATGIGVGNGYMFDKSIHVDIAWKGDQAGVIGGILPNRYWGGGTGTGTKTSTVNAPLYLSQLMQTKDNIA